MLLFVKRVLAVVCILSLGIFPQAQAALYVSDQANGTIYSGPNSGGQLTTFIPSGTGGLTKSVGMLLHPQTGMLLVSNQTAAGSVKIFNPTTGAYAGDFASGINFPSAITLGQHNDILVTGFFGPQGIYRFDYNGNPLSTITGGGLSSVSASQFGSDNKLYAASYGTGQILRYAWDAMANNYLLDTSIPGGVFIEGAGPGDPNNLSNPGGFTFHNGKVYVMNLTNQNILTYDAMTGAFDSVFSAGNASAFPAQISFLGDTALVAQVNYDFGIGMYDSNGLYTGTFAVPPPGSNAISGAFLFTPVPEPGTWVALAFLGGGWCLSRRRRPSAV